MAAGDIYTTDDLVVDEVTVKTNEDIELGEFVVDDGNGYLAATAALAALSKPCVALEAHDYSETTNHKIRVLRRGVVEAQKKANSGDVFSGNKLMISSTAGECQVFAAGDVTSTVTEATIEAAMLVNLGAFGEANANAATADTTVKVRL